MAAESDESADIRPRIDPIADRWFIQHGSTRRPRAMGR